MIHLKYLICDVLKLQYEFAELTFNTKKQIQDILPQLKPTEFDMNKMHSSHQSESHRNHTKLILLSCTDNCLNGKFFIAYST